MNPLHTLISCNFKAHLLLVFHLNILAFVLSDIFLPISPCYGLYFADCRDSLAAVSIHEPMLIAWNLTRQLRVPETTNRQPGPGLGSEKVTAGGPNYRGSTPCTARDFLVSQRLKSGCGAQSGSGVQSESGVLSGSGVHPASCSISATIGLHGILRPWREAGEVKVAWNRTSIPLYAIMTWYLTFRRLMSTIVDVPHR